MHNRGHHPEVLEQGEGRWVVRCPECQQEKDVPIGIGAPVQTRHVAEMMRQNHVGPVGDGLR